MKVGILILLLISSVSLAGGGVGGSGLGKQLQDLAVSETVLSGREMNEFVRNRVVRESVPSVISERSGWIRLNPVAESSGILIDVEPTDLNEITARAANSEDFIYRNEVAKVIEVNHEHNSVTLGLVEDPSVMIVVTDSQAE